MWGMGFPSLSAGRPRPACRGWEQGPEGRGRRARRLLPDGSVGAKDLVMALSGVLLSLGGDCRCPPGVPGAGKDLETRSIQAACVTAAAS
ncbi:hypothetical protein GCM10010384_11830 [Streptomyces djakartensis]|uniref:Uncharacterized protein n=1 Tax=Streptomyces djakartensis TaxID=68193 RepID=A0ABQ2Z940_9ACTN|nr:hypothetical protein GCM10010384_11830 [Streptomyces djakartensis]